MRRLTLEELLHDLADPAENLLVVQDLDGVCMPLVRDPQTRTLEPRYIRAAARMGDQFRVLTNGEHSGRLGVNRLVEIALAPDLDPARGGYYLPGLAAGGVQQQDCFGALSHPGVSAAEWTFLQAVPEQLCSGLDSLVRDLMPDLIRGEREALLLSCVLDNAVSPTLNINSVVEAIGPEPNGIRALQVAAYQLLEELLHQAGNAGLVERFFIHLAPNLGSEAGRERLKLATSSQVGTTDFQFMLRGAVKEAGLLVLINQRIQRQTGQAPLGDDFHVRSAPTEPDALLELAKEHIPQALMPRVVGVGDTITSEPGPMGEGWQRGGSDRGFLTLVQELGRAFGLPNRVMLVDSSGGELNRPSHQDPTLRGLSDPEDPLQLDALVPGGPSQYRQWFETLSQERS